MNLLDGRPNSCSPSARQLRDAPNRHMPPAPWNGSPNRRSRAEPGDRARTDLVAGTPVMSPADKPTENSAESYQGAQQRNAAGFGSCARRSCNREVRFGGCASSCGSAIRKSQRDRRNERTARHAEKFRGFRAKSRGTSSVELSPKVINASYVGVK